MVKQAEMDKAIQKWLESHASYKAFLEDTRVLFELFASGWHGHGLTEAFDTFRQGLLLTQGYSPSEIRELYPRSKQDAI
jgi:hypothetical protein